MAIEARCCPLCAHTHTNAVFTVDKRAFHECPGCDLLFVDEGSFLSLEQEKQRYDLHQNDPSDSGYVAHLSRLKDALLPHLLPGARGLDFGCGPAPVLAQLFTAQGFEMQNYDRVYSPVVPLSAAPFDFITCCEVAEHFQYPSEEFSLMRSLCKTGSWIALMTNFRTEDRRGPDWWYLKDPTHMCFYSADTLHKLAALQNWQLLHAKDDIALFQVAS